MYVFIYTYILKRSYVIDGRQFMSQRVKYTPFEGHGHCLTKNEKRQKNKRKFYLLRITL